MWRLLFFLLLSQSFTAQNIIKGKVQSEDNVSLNGVLVINMNTNDKTTTDTEGWFSLFVKAGDEVRFIRNGYERGRILVTEQHLKQTNILSLKPVVQEIEEVKIVPLTGNLAKDSKRLGESKVITDRKIELGRYIKFHKSTREITKPKRGDFVQPKGLGFSIGKVKNQWENIHLVEYLISVVEEDFFITDLQLKKEEISAFLMFSIRDLQGLHHILKYGECTDKCVLNYMEHAYRKIKEYKK